MTTWFKGHLRVVCYGYASYFSHPMTQELVPDEVDGWRCTGSIDERGPNAVAVSLDLLKIGTSAKGHSRGRFMPPFQLEPIHKLNI